jgi:soluble lytic murein transglycosylase
LVVSVVAFAKPTVSATLELNTASGPAQVTLAEVIEGNKLGIQMEPEKVHVRVRNSARKYVAWKRGILTPVEFEAWKKSCETDPDSDDFCPLLMGKDPSEFVDSEDEVKDEAETEAPLSGTAKEMVVAWRAGDFATLKRGTSSSLYRSLRAFKDWSGLEKATERVLDTSESSNCDNPAVATALAQKAENFLPDRKYREIAYKIYEKVIACPVGEHASRSRFRYSLLKIEDGECKVADPLLERLYQTSDAEYTARTLYWRARCAETRGDRMKAEVFKQRLLKESPLSYHSILLNRAEVAKLMRVAGSGEPTVLFRSHTQPKLNQWVRAIEGLASIGADEVARRIFYKCVDTLQKTEPELRLYLGTLSYRVGDTISQFRLLSSVFRDEPRLISQTTLKLFYPMKNFPLIRKYAKETDPYFVAALIRQESGFNPWARSRVGAMGLMQLMPRTAKQLERVSKRALFLPETNIRIGTRYIGNLVNKYDRDAELALAAYNAGSDRVDDWKQRYPTTDRMLFLDLIPFKETRDYVVLIGRNYYWYHTLYGEAPAVPLRAGGKSFGRSIATEAVGKPLIFSLFL